MSALTRILIFIILFLIDFYVFQAIKLVTKNLSDTTKMLIYCGYWSMTLFSFIILLINSFYDFHSWNRAVAIYSFAFIIITYFSKLLILIFLLVDDIIRLFRWTFGLFQKNVDSGNGIQKVNTGISRLEFLSKLGLIIGGIPFISMIYGMIRGPYRFEVRTEKLTFNKLPSSFNGLKIVQISDIHTGSFLTTHPMQDMVNLVMKQNADIIFFTGDLVNDKNDEVTEFKSILKQITAPLGVFSIFGNHDYGDYIKWESKEEKTANLHRLKETHKELGWNLLLNTHFILQKGEDKIGIIGVENWSSVGCFPKYGDLKMATENMPEVPVKILLSHDPSHWHSEITPKYKDIDLTLSGHTHGMQWGVEIPGFKWSPVQYVYKEWAGLYRKESQYIYVNRGVGFLGYPGRVGIMPEITVIELYNS